MKRKMNFCQKAGLYTVFAGPTMLFFFLFVIVPLVYGMFLTFTDWNGLASTMKFVGLENYAAALADTQYWKALGMTVGYSVISVILINLAAFGIAYLLTSGVRGQNFLRAGFFTPNLIGGLILGYVWEFVFSRVLPSLHSVIPADILEKSWLSAPGTAFAALIIVTVWKNSGYMLLIYIAGFVGVPMDLVEAARIDGATEAKVMRYIRLPLMVSSFVICLFLSLTRTFKVYDLNLSLTGGGPYGSTKLAAMHIFTTAFENQNYGVGQAEAFVLFLVLSVITLTQTYIGKKREVEM